MKALPHVSVSSGPVQLRIDAAANGAFASLQYGAQGVNLIGAADNLWTADLASGEKLRAGSADRFEWQAANLTLTLLWHFDAPAVRVEVELTPEPAAGTVAARWSLHCVHGEGIRVAEVCFPRFRAAEAVTSIMRPACSYWQELRVEDYMRTEWDEAEIAAMAEGMIHDGVCDAAGYYGGLYPGAWSAVPFFAAWTGTGTGLYIGVHDEDAHTKTLLWDQREIGVTYHVPDPDQARRELHVPYPVVIAAYRGDWQSGADIYRNWVRNHSPWCRRGPLTKTAPDWAQHSVAWFYNLADFPLPLPELLPRLREVFGIEGPIGVHQFGPNVQDHSNMPLGESDRWLRDFRAHLIRIGREHGFFAFEYRNAHKHTKDYPGYENARPHAFRWRGRLHEEGPYSGGPNFRSRSVPAGTPGSETRGIGEDAYAETIERHDYPLVEMCMATEYWQQKLLDSVAPCPGYGLVGNYLDQIGHNRNMSRCDAVGHGHPVRGGNWYVRAHEKVLRGIIRHYRLQGVARPLLSHESFCEPLLGLLNTALLEGDLRLLSYVYHAYVFLESHEPYSGFETLGALRRALARDFHEGRMPTLNLPCSLPGVDLTAVLRGERNAADSEALRMIRQWLTVRAAWLSYLNLGTMLPAPVPAPGSGAVITSAWRNPHGAVAHFASNATARDQVLVLELEAPPAGPWRAWLGTQQGELRVAARFERKLAPDETLVIESATEGPL